LARLDAANGMQVVAQYKSDPAFDGFVATMPVQYQADFRSRYM
jgi:hypothetical protein